MHVHLQQIFTEHLLCASKFRPHLSAWLSGSYLLSNMLYSPADTVPKSHVTWKKNGSVSDHECYPNSHASTVEGPLATHHLPSHKPYLGSHWHSVFQYKCFLRLKKKKKKIKYLLYGEHTTSTALYVCLSTKKQKHLKSIQTTLLEEKKVTLLGNRLNGLESTVQGDPVAQRPRN